MIVATLRNRCEQVHFKTSTDESNVGLLFRGHRQIQDSQTTVERKLGLATLFVHVYFEDVGWTVALKSALLCPRLT